MTPKEGIAMRITIALILALSLSACNSGSDNDSAFATKAQLPPNEATAVAALQAEVAQLQSTLQADAVPNESTQVAALQVSLHKLQLIGQAHGVTTSDHTLAIGQAAATAISFGPCTDMGVLVGFTNTGDNIGAGALSASYQAFKTCTGYVYEAAVQDGSIKPASRIFWDGPNCTGNMLEWEAGGAGYNTQTLQNGVVFIAPNDSTTQLMVQASQTPQPRLIQSAWVFDNPGCQSDVETQPVYQVSPNVTSVTGVPNMTVGNFTLTSP